MRLINTSTKKFEEFIGRDKPEYAILSHTWGDEEVLYSDYNNPSAVSKQGYRKIKMSRKLAARDGIKYLWVDTCNIDKSSSAELTEAINSMFQWYQRSKVCYVVLEDLIASAPIDAVKDCRWFTRGWTLQELIAPTRVLFYDQDWNYRGSKEDLVKLLSKITKIDSEVLLRRRVLSTVAVAQRMSWAALRKTRRIEDMAYCLLGIFDVNMPLLYGEEDKAFRRLQEAIIKSTSDLSIFAWRLPQPRETTMQDRKICGILAQTPAAFASCSSIIHNSDHVPEEFAVTSIGIKTRIRVIVPSFMHGNEVKYGYVLPLRCSAGNDQALGVRLRKCGYDQFVREDPWNLFECRDHSWFDAPKDIFLLTDLLDPEVGLSPIMSMRPYILRSRSYVLQISSSHGTNISDTWNRSRFDAEDVSYFVLGDTGWDSSSLRLKVTIPGQMSPSFCTFYGIGWSDLVQNSFQFTLVEEQAFRGSSDAIQSQLDEWDHDTARVINILIHYGIPRTSSVVIKRPGMLKTALISCEATLVEDSNICSNKFWRVEFSVRLLEDQDVPQIKRRNWRRLRSTA